MPTYTLITFGCQMNQHDSTRMAEVLQSAGYRSVERPEQADVVVLNTCSIRDKAEQKLRSEVGRLGVLKRKKPQMLIAVAGCVAQQEGERLLRKAKEIDLVLGPDNILELPGLLAEFEHGSPPRVRTEFDLLSPHFLRAQPKGDSARPSAYVTVMKGCDERCTYCIVPYTRGPERYRSSAEIVEEIGALVAAGVREVTLLGQTVNSYRDPLNALARAPGCGEFPWLHTRKHLAEADESEFAALLRRIAQQVPGLDRLRYTSPHPRHLTMSLVRAHQDLQVLVRHVHLPVQSGSDAVLRRMVRRYSRAEFLERSERLRSDVPGLTLTTDIIVGFPGESSSEFAETLSLVQEVQFAGLYGFKYSPRPFTPALKLADDVPEEEKSERLARLFELSERLKFEYLRGLVDSEQIVLVEGRGRDGRFEGRTERNEIVHFEANEQAVGQMIRVKITNAFKNSVEGAVMEDRWRSIPPAAGTPTAAVDTSRRILPMV